MALVEIERTSLPSGCLKTTLETQNGSLPSTSKAASDSTKRRSGIWDSSHVIEQRVDRYGEIPRSIGPAAIQLGSPYHEDLSNLNKNGHGDCIRLLKVYGVTKTAALCDLCVFSLQDAPPYAALSYCWGEAKPDKDAIFARPGSHGTFRPSGFLKITCHLHAGLRSIKNFNKLGWLWNDATCINQDSDKEKNDQVSRMKNIFSRAERVYVWLGSDVRKKSRYTPAVPSFTTRSRDNYVWWKRLWVVQEYATCKNVAMVFGDRIAGWQAFMSLLTTYPHHEPSQTPLEDAELLTDDVDLHGSFELSRAEQHEIIDAHKGVAIFMTIERLAAALMHIRSDFLTSEGLGLDILDLLRRTALLGNGFSEPHDRVFSLLGLAHAEARDDIPIEYDAALARVFANVIKFALHTNRSIEYLWGLWPCGEGIDPSLSASGTITYELPAWMPDFTKPLVNRNLLSDFYAFNATQDTRMAYEIDMYSFHLRLTAISCGRVQRHWPIRRRTIEAPGGTPESLESISIQAAEEQLDAVGITDNSRHSLVRSNAVRSSLLFAHKILSIAGNRSVEIFRTDLGLTGCCAIENLQKGDEIILPLGFKVPWAIQPSRGDPNSGGVQMFSLTDECYVDGVMDGELVELWREGKVESATYELR